MQIHYFQRYHSQENVATANTMLLLSRLYSYLPSKFFNLLKAEFSLEKFNPELKFVIQEKNEKSTPDATITQESFKIVIETKITDWFYNEQLKRHLDSFEDEKNKVLITIASELMEEDKYKKFEEELKEYNSKKNCHIKHINTTFEKLATSIGDVLDDRDYEMGDILDDYLNYCYDCNLISGADSYKYLRMQLAGTTLDFNVQENVYYDNAKRGFRPHDYLGLYKNKTVQVIGKITARILAVKKEGNLEFKVEFGDLTEERKEKIIKSIEYGRENYGYDLESTEHRYFFVDKFYKTNFRKTSKGGSMGTRIFNICEVLGENKVPEVDVLAKKLENKTWE